jgi:hypothetical protein
MSEDAVRARITAFWDAAAPGYDCPDNVAAPGTSEHTDWVAALTAVLPGTPGRVLDVGTGTCLSRPGAMARCRLIGSARQKSKLTAAADRSTR